MTRLVDLGIVAIYLAFMAVLGIWFSRRQTSTENYFVAKRSVPSWPMGMSMLATMVSSGTFVAYSGSAYPKDWSLLILGFFLLALLTSRAIRLSAWTGILCSTAFTVWAVLTKGANPLLKLRSFHNRGDDLTIGAIGNAVLFGSGLILTLFTRLAESNVKGTLWHWLASLHSPTIQKGAYA